MLAGVSTRAQATRIKARPTDKVPNIKGAFPVFVSFKDCGDEGVPTSTSPKLRAELDNDTCALAPKPDKATVSVLEAAFEGMVIVPVDAPGDVGAKRTLKAQFALGAITAFEQTLPGKL